jgi:hypothetical protein
MHEDATAPVANPVIHPACARRCFVISPIGMEGSQEREHADDVFDYIIKPALEAAGWPGTRCQRGTQLYSTFQRELDSLWDVNGGD